MKWQTWTAYFSAMALALGGVVAATINLGDDDPPRNLGLALIVMALVVAKNAHLLEGDEK